MDLSIVATKTSYPLKLNLGCGYQPMNGWVNVDYIKTDHADIVTNLDQPWPWKDNSVDEIFAAHVLEHVTDHITFMKEAQRVLKVGGYFTIRVPHGWSDAAMGDPTHKRPFFVSTFVGFCKDYSPKQTLNPQHDKDRWPFTFEMLQCDIVLQNWVKRFPFWRYYSDFFLKRFLNAAHEIAVILQKR